MNILNKEVILYTQPMRMNAENASPQGPPTLYVFMCVSVCIYFHTLELGGGGGTSFHVAWELFILEFMFSRVWGLSCPCA
jgi:hypothetical protein